RDNRLARPRLRRSPRRVGPRPRCSSSALRRAAAAAPVRSSPPSPGTTDAPPAPAPPEPLRRRRSPPGATRGAGASEEPRNLPPDRASSYAGDLLPAAFDLEGRGGEQFIPEAAERRGRRR